MGKQNSWKRFYLAGLLVMLISISGYSQVILGCAGTSAFNKDSRPDLGIVIYSSDEETVWNALRLATYSQSQGDSVVVFLIGKGIDPFMKDTNSFDIKPLQLKFLQNGGQIIACGTCAKLRGTDEIKMCTIASITDLYEIIRRSKKTISF